MPGLNPGDGIYEGICVDDRLVLAVLDQSQLFSTSGFVGVLTAGHLRVPYRCVESWCPPLS